jgi:glucose-1-phosphate thymidylyltransferase
MVVPPVNIHVNAKIKDSVIGPFATIGADCRIDGSIIRDSIVDQDAQITDAVLAQSLIGRGARVRGMFHTINVGAQSELGLE